jgi:hypothetical protein
MDDVKLPDSIEDYIDHTPQYIYVNDVMYIIDNKWNMKNDSINKYDNKENSIVLKSLKNDIECKIINVKVAFGK